MPDVLVIQISGDATELISALKKSGVGVDKFSKGIKTSSSKSSKAFGTFVSGAKAGILGVGTVLFGLGVGFASVTKKGVDFANETNKAMEDFGFQTGIAADELDDFKDVALDVFAANWGESIEDVGAAMTKVRQVTQAEGKDLEALTTNALILRDRFGVDVAEGISTAKTLMDEFGLTGEQSFDFIISGIQKGLDTNGDFLDSIGEYSNLFAQGNGDAGEFFSLLETGMAGGVLGTDKAADAFKEFSIRVLDLSDSTADGFDKMGINYDDFLASISNGDATMAEAMQSVIFHLSQIEDPIERNIAGTQLFGSQWEDLGEKALLAIDTSTTSLESLSGATQQAALDATDLTTSVGALGRQFLVDIEPVAQELLPLLQEGLRLAGEFLKEAAPIFTEFAVDLKENLGPAMTLINDAAVRIATVFGLATEETDGMDLALSVLKGTLDLVVTGIQAVAVAAQLMADAIEIAAGLIDQLQTINQLTAAQSGSFGDLEAAQFGGLPGFQFGGTVPGPAGKPRLIVAHGGEEITPAGEGAGTTMNINIFANSQAEGEEAGRGFINEMQARGVPI